MQVDVCLLGFAGLREIFSFPFSIFHPASQSVRATNPFTCSDKDKTFII